MRSRLLPFAGILLVMPSVCSASSYVIPTTTLAAQTSNNTSASSGFPSQSNGNRGAGNVSKVDVHSLLYSGTTTKVYAHLMLWFGPGSGHMDVGYSSTNPGQVNSQINDMVSRGIDGVIIDWYGPNNFIDQATQLVMAAAQNHPGFTFAIMVDAGAIAGNSCWGCSAQQVLINLLQYIEHNYFSSPAYMTRQGRPVVTNFNIDYNYGIDWNTVSNSLNAQPMFLFQDNVGFGQALSGGSYAWVMPTIGDYGFSYLSNFYQTGMSFPHEQTVGASYKGFNDSLAPWDSGRVMGQQCGQTWLQTFSQVNSLYNSGTQLTDLQLVTWNDYEEATEIESGIDNCLSISASISGNGLQWTLNGNSNTVDHYAVYASTDGQNLMPLANLAPQVNSLNLCSFPVPAGSYKLFVQAVGRPSIANQITAALPYNSTCALPVGTSGGSNVSFSASPSSLVISPGKSGTFTVTAQMQSGTLNDPISLSCSGVPSNLNCTFSPVSITPGSGVATSAVTVSAAGQAASARPRKIIPIYTGWLLLPLGMMGLPFMGTIRGQGKARLLAISLLFAFGMITASCGGKSSGPQASSQSGPGNYSVTINGNSSSSQLTTVVSITVQ
jgi:hypothetical protein